MLKQTTTYHTYHSGSGMAMDAQGGHLWVVMWIRGSKGTVGHGNGAWGDTDSCCDREFGHAVHAKLTTRTQQSGR